MPRRSSASASARACAGAATQAAAPSVAARTPRREGRAAMTSSRFANQVSDCARAERPSKCRRLCAIANLEEPLMTSPVLENDLRAAIRSIPDYPKPGIIFRDITTLLGSPRAFRRAVDELVQPWAGSKIDKVAGIEARGFIIGGAVAHQVSAGFVPIRKKGKLPHQTVRMAYLLEYGSDEMEMHVDAISKGDRVVLVDDLIATGGTAEGAVKLLRQVGAEVLAACFIIDLPELGGADKLRKLDVPVRTLVSFEGH
jgi:adenine phosphoribosyltransferase